MMLDLSGPAAALRSAGVPCLFASREARGSDQRGQFWDYELGFVGTSALVSVSHMLVDGWDVMVLPRSGRLAIRVRRGQ